MKTQISCKTCGLNSGNLKDYVPTYRKAGQYRNVCWDCWRKSGTAYRKTFRTKRKAIINKAKDVPCADCNVKYPPHIMDFDHIEDNKLFNISDGWFNASLAVIQAEIEKCEVVCANCHRDRTFKRLQ